MRRLLLLLALSAPLAARADVNAASCSSSDVQAAINSATQGQTVHVPAGACTWATGVSVTGKGINIVGAGYSPIIAISADTLTLSNGSKTLSVQTSKPSTALSISPGTTLTIAETGTEANFLTGTVTSYSSGTLVMNITSHGGTCGSNSLSNCKRWLIEVPQDAATMTLITNNDTSSTPLFSITEDTEFHTSLSNLTVTAGTGNSNIVIVTGSSSGLPVLIHHVRFTGDPDNGSPPSGNATMILLNTNNGVVWHSSFDSNPFNISTLGAVSVQIDGSSTSWTTASNMGSLNTTGTGEVFFEDNDYHAMASATNTDNNGRAVWRYSLYDNSGVGTHGADTSDYGQRYFEFYGNVMVFEGFSDGSTLNMANGWIYMRGGTALIYNNTIPALVSTDYGTKPDWNATVMNLQRNSGPDHCWGSGTHTAGQFYPAPRQVGMGDPTGSSTGRVNYPPLGISNQANDSITYGGESESVFMWGNTRSPLTVAISDFGGTDCANPDSSANYIQSGRDYFNGSTAKPGWSAYTYPHPLTGSAPIAGSSASGAKLRGATIRY
jgi:hypothetical protein